MLRLKGCLLAACLLSPLTQAADLGTWGDLWPIREQDMLQLITQRLQSLQSSGQWDQTMDAFKQRVIENSQRPAPVEGIKRAEKYEQRWFDPSIRLTEDLKDNEGRVFARKGDVVNPLKTVPFVQTLYFIRALRKSVRVFTETSLFYREGLNIQAFTGWRRRDPRRDCRQAKSLAQYAVLVEIDPAVQRCGGVRDTATHQDNLLIRVSGT